eukprot:1864536-Lingulodinium_polyedra.AAC.1
MSVVLAIPRGDPSLLAASCTGLARSTGLARGCCRGGAERGSLVACSETLRTTAEQWVAKTGHAERAASASSPL